MEEQKRKPALSLEDTITLLAAERHRVLKVESLNPIAMAALVLSVGSSIRRESDQSMAGQ